MSKIDRVTNSILYGIYFLTTFITDPVATIWSWSEMNPTQLLLQGNYPSLVSLAAFNNIIYKCWTQSYASVDELLDDVKAEGMNFKYRKIVQD